MSYPITGKKVSKLELLKQCNEQIELLKIKQSVIDKIMPVLRTFNGKQVSRRIESKLKELYPELTISYHISYTYIELRVWGNGLKYDNAITFNLCRIDSDKIMDYESVCENINQYDCIGYIEKLELFKTNINHYIVKWNELIDYLETMGETFKNIPYPASKSFYMRDLLY